MAVSTNSGPPLVIPLVGLRGKKFGHLTFRSLRDERSNSSPCFVNASLRPRSFCLVLVLLRIAHFPIVIEDGYAVPTNSTDDTVCFQLNSKPTFEYTFSLGP